METTTTLTSQKQIQEFALPLGANAPRGEAASKLPLPFKKPETTEPQPAWALAALYFTIELP